MPTLYPLVKEAAKHCWGKNYLDVFKQFCAKHASKFKDAPLTVAGGEQNLEFYSLYQEYLQLYETTLSKYIESLNVSIEEFYQELIAVKDDTNIKDKKLLYFVNYLLASTDYDAFYKIMVRAAKKLATDPVENVNGEEEDNDAKAESKSSGTRNNDHDDGEEHKSESKKTYSHESKGHK